MLFEDLVNVPVHSLDIETTGFEHKQHRIWSVGLAASDPSKSMERFIGGIVDANSSDVVGDFLNVAKQDGSEVFASKQMARNSFDPYFDKFKSGHLTNIGSALNEAGNILADAPGVLLIQNVPFEHGAFAAARSKQGAEQGLSSAESSQFTSKVFGQPLAPSPIVLDPEIAKKRTEFMKAIDEQMRIGRDAKDLHLLKANSIKLKETSQALENTISSTIKNNLKRSASTTIDLMDISRMYLTDLHLGGELDQGFLKTGTKVEFLVGQLFSGMRESHTALSDAEQQADIFKELNLRRANIAKNGLSDVDRAFAAKVAEPLTDAKLFLSAITENLQKSASDISTKELDNVFEGIIKLRENKPDGGFSRKGYVSSVLDKHRDGASIEDLIRHVSDESENLDVSKYVKDGDTPTRNTGSVLDAFKNSSTKTKVMVGAGALVGVGLLSSGPRRDVEEPRRKQETGAYNELYENVYAGQAYADWQQRNNSHKMSY